MVTLFTPLFTVKMMFYVDDIMFTLMTAGVFHVTNLTPRECQPTLLRGQDTATNLLADAICDHVENPRPGKPLVAALHGSPGVGKSYFHQLLAQAMYNATDEEYFAHEHAQHDAEAPDADGGGGGGGGDGGGGGGGGGGGWMDAATSYVRGVSGWGESHSTSNTAVTHRTTRECPGRHCPGYKIIFGTDYVTVGLCRLNQFDP